MANPFTIIHCFRAPLGGLFRHVCDLVREQAALGHKVGIVCDASSGGRAAEQTLAKIAGSCALGVHRTPMSRGVGPRDLLATRFVRRLVHDLGGVDILHGHGAKGGAYARLACRKLKRKGLAKRALYTPHGGSLHYSPESLKGRIYLALERRLAALSDGLIFESGYSSTLFEAKVGTPPCPTRIIPNGLRKSDFYDITLANEATDFLFIGELRRLKGVDVLLEALAQVRAARHVDATIIGTGPDEREFKDMAKSLGVDDCVSFPGYVPADLAFVRGRCLVVPSRAESFPYIVLEAAALKMPTILSDVGGIPEICGGLDMELLEPGNADALARAMTSFLDDPLSFLERAEIFRESVAKRYTSEKMAQTINEFYADLLA